METDAFYDTEHRESYVYDPETTNKNTEYMFNLCQN